MDDFDTRANEHVSYVADNGALGSGALSLITDSNPASGQDKAQYYSYPYFTNPIYLSDVTGTLSYKTKQVAASFSAGLPAYQIPVYLQNTAGSDIFATLTYEPYVDKGNSAVENGVWQSWSIDRGSSKFYVSRTVSNANGGVVTSQGSNTYTLDQINTIFPDAKVLGYGVNVGSNNPGYNTRTDAFTFNNTTFNFEEDDTTAPVLSDFSATQNSDGTYTLLVKTDDIASPVKFSLDGIELTGETSADGGTTWLVTTAVLMAGSAHTYSVTSKDDSNNETTVSGTFTVPATNSGGSGSNPGTTTTTNNSSSTTSSPITTPAQITPLAANSNFNSFFSSLGNGANTTTGNSATEDTKGDVLGATSDESKDKVAAIAPSSDGWKIWGIAWYWWILILALLAGAYYWFAARRRQAE